MLKKFQVDMLETRYVVKVDLRSHVCVPCGPRLLGTEVRVGDLNHADGKVVVCIPEEKSKLNTASSNHSLLTKAHLMPCATI